RPHFSFGTVEVRICDAQGTAAESEALAALMVACVAQAARDLDEGRPHQDLPRRLIEENFWRAIRHGQDGMLIDFATETEYTSADARVGWRRAPRTSATPSSCARRSRACARCCRWWRRRWAPTRARSATR